VAVAIPTHLVVSEESGTKSGDWYKLITTATGSTNVADFNDATQMSYKHALSSALGGLVPVENMILLIEPATDGVTVSCALEIPTSSSAAIGASLGDATFVDTFTAAASVEGISLRRITFTKALSNTAVTSFESLFGISAPDSGSTLGQASVKQSSEPAHFEFNQAGKFVGIGFVGVLCAALVAGVAVKARGQFSKTDQVPSALAVDQFALTPSKIDSL
jgi:hypothetical protein